MIVTQYETLRRAALGDALPPEARSGLTLFLRRGMLAWVRAVATASALQEPTRAPLSHRRMAEEYSAIIHIFAAMAISVNHQGGTP
jgi:hypothetical protein